MALFELLTISNIWQACCSYSQHRWRNCQRHSNPDHSVSTSAYRVEYQLTLSSLDGTDGETAAQVGAAVEAIVEEIQAEAKDDITVSLLDHEFEYY